MAASTVPRGNEEWYDSDSEDEVDYPFGDEDDEEMVDTVAPSKCLFCECIHATGEQNLKHVEDEHTVPLAEMFREATFDFYSYIKVINYFRKHQPTEAQCQSKESLDKLLSVLDDSYMIPEDSEDSLLQFDFDNYQEKLRRLAPVASGTVTIATGEYHALKSHAMEIERLKNELEALNERHTTDLSALRLSARRFVAASSTTPGGGPERPSIKNERNASQVHSLTESEDDTYIGSYSHYSIHLEMLQDRVRTESYLKAIMGNPDMFKDKVVLDVGCGTGILSMFAARAGAKLVIGVDMSDIIYQAMDIVRENGLEEKITLIKGRIEEITLPVNTVDIIVSEWMGYFLLFESMLDSVIYARNKWLSPEGIVWPNECSILLTASCDRALHDRNILFWDDVYGFKMSCMKRAVCKDALVQCTAAEFQVCQPTVIKTVDCCCSDVADLDFTSPFTMAVDKDSTIYAIIGYFDCSFLSSKASTKVEFSTGPGSTATHWKQTVFLLSKPLDRIKGEHISGCIDVRKAPKDPRSLQVQITIDNVTSKYLLC